MAEEKKYRDMNSEEQEVELFTMQEYYNQIVRGMNGLAKQKKIGMPLTGVKEGILTMLKEVFPD